VRAIGALGAPAAPVVEGLGVLLTHASLSLRAETLESFGKLGPHAAVQATAVEARLQDAAEDPYLRRLAAEALGRKGPAGADALVRAFTLADDDLAVRAALSLGAAADTEAVARLITALADPDARMRRLAALALAKRGAPALPAYDALTVAAGDRDPLVRRNAVEALGRLGDARAVALCETALKDRDAGVAYAAAGAIETLATNAADADRLLADYRAAVAWKPSPGKEKEYRLTEKERQQYEIGGPLAGLRLPLFKGQHGEEPGYPGCLPELIASSEKKEDMGNTYEDWGPKWNSIRARWSITATTCSSITRPAAFTTGKAS
jgi:HEAT repeat protein